MKKKALSLLLVLVMVLSMLPVSSLATGLWGNLELSENLTAEAEEITLADSSAQTQPFPSGTLGSEKFRIPSIVTLNDGTIVAAADARWNDSTDGGGIDTIVSISKDNGATWISSFANYLADNNKAYNVNSATFIDPALASDGKKLYMLVDLYPAGYSNLGDFGTYGFTLQSTENGFDSQGRLIISKGTGSRSTTDGGYYLGEFGTDGFASIYSTSGAAVACYKVDRWFNLYKDDEKVSNLYYYGADYQAFPVQYLYQTESTDGGQTWSAPKLLNLKQNGEVFCGVCPGSGYVTSTGRIIFLVYDCARIFGSMQTSVVYSDDQGKTWHRGAAIGNDGQMSEATLSEVYLKGNCYLYALGRENNSYFVSSDDGETWTSATSTGLSYQTGSAMGSITYSKLIDGCPAIILAAPSGSASRTAGKLYVGLVQSNGTIVWKYTYAVNGSSYYAYSDLIELSNGSIGLLYESDSAAITFKELPISIIAPDATIGGAAFPEIVKVNDTTYGISVTAPGLTSLSVEPQEGVTIEGAEIVLAYDITPETTYGKYTGKASVTFTLPEGWSDSARIKGFVENSSGFDTLDASVADGAATVTFPHFSVGGIYYEAEQNNVDSDASTKEQLTLTVGETSKTYAIPGDYSSLDGQTVGSIATISAEKKTSAASVVYESAEFGNGTFYLSTQSSNPTDLVEVTIEDYANGTCYVNQGSSYVYPNATYSLVSWSYSASTEGSKNTPVTVTVNTDGSVKLTRNVSVQIIISTTTTTTGLTVSNNALGAIENGDNLYLYTKKNVPGSDYTEITFTAIADGEVTTTIGTTQFDITVNKQTKTVNVKPGESTTINNAGTTITKYPDPTVATAYLDGTTLTITGVKDGKTEFETDTTKYIVVVADVPSTTGTNKLVSKNSVNNVINAGDNVTGLLLSYYANNGTVITQTSFSVAAQDKNGNSLTVASWQSTDENIATVSDDGTITAQGIGECLVIAHFSDGTQTVIPVRVVKGNTVSNSEDTNHLFTFYADGLYHTELYYVLVSGDAKDLEWTQVPEGYVFYAYVDSALNSGIIFATKPDEGYAITCFGQSSNGTSMYSNTYYNYIGRVEKKDSDGNTYYTYGSGSTSASDPYYFYDYSSKLYLASSTGQIYEQTDFEALLQKAVDNNFSAACFYSLITSQTIGVSMKMQFISDRLPTLEKTVASVNGKTYVEGETTIGLGDTITYDVTFTTYKSHSSTFTPNSNVSAYGTDKYTDAVWSDPLTGVNKESITLPNSTETAGTFRAVPEDVVQSTVKKSTSLTLTMENFNNVKDNILTNTATLEYTYDTQFSKGTAKSTANALAKCFITTPTFVVDFGLNVDLDLKDVLGNIEIKNATSTNSNTVSSSGQTLTYSASKTIPANGDYIQLDLADNLYYGVTIIPASNVLYEENFFTAGNRWTKAGTTPTSKQQTQQVGGNGDYYVFGYDKVYDSATGAQGYYGATDLSTSAITGQLTTSFYGNAFDLIGNCGPDTGRVLMLISGNNKNYIYDVDTRYSAGTLNQVPLAHAELGTDANYTVKISAAGLAASASANANAASTFSVSGSADALTLFLAENDLTAADVEIISVTPELVAYASAVSVNDLAEATATVSHAAGTHVEIDAFRVYRSSSNENYPTAEKDVKYVNCLDAVNGEVLTAYTESGTVTNIAVGEYEGSGGPQNEIYLANGQSVTFGVTGMKVVQVSLRAVSGETTWNSNTIQSNTEMYYNVTANDDGLFTVTNTGNNLLAIGNLKLESGAIVQPASDFSTEMLLRSVQATMASAPVETEPEYDPFVDVKLRTTSLLRKKLVTLTITTSTDVESLTVNGYKLNPVNKWMVQTGRATTYTYILADTVSKNTTKTYEITAVNANGQSCTVTKQA